MNKLVIPANADNKVVAGENAKTGAVFAKRFMSDVSDFILKAKTAKDAKEVFEKNIASEMLDFMMEFAKSGSPICIKYDFINSRKIGSLVFFIWSKDGVELNFDTFTINVKDCTPLAMLWKECAGKLPDMIYEHRDIIKYIPANSKYEACNEVCKILSNETI